MIKWVIVLCIAFQFSALHCTAPPWVHTGLHFTEAASKSNFERLWCWNILLVMPLSIKHLNFSYIFDLSQVCLDRVTQNFIFILYLYHNLAINYKSTISILGVSDKSLYLLEGNSVNHSIFNMHLFSNRGSHSCYPCLLWKSVKWISALKSAYLSSNSLRK